MTRTKSSRALLSVVLAVLMVAAFMPALTYSSFAATAKKATKVTKLTHTGAKVYGKVGNKYVLKYKLSPSKLTSAAKKTVWKSSDSSIVKVYSTKSNRAAVKAKAEGTAKVTVYTKANKKAKTTWTFKVTKKAETKTTLTGVTVSAPNAADPAKEVKVGTTLHASVAPTDAKDVTYQWYANDTAISGATSADYTVTAAESGKTITVKATSQNEVASTATAKVATVTLKNVAVSKVTKDASGKETVSKNAISTLAVGDVLRAVPETDPENAKLSDIADVQWYRVSKAGNDQKVDTAISGATSADYTVTAADKDYSLKVKVTPKAGVLGIARTAFAGTEAVKVSNSANVTATQKDSTATVGDTLQVVTNPTAASSALTYQWAYRAKDSDPYTAISGATSATYKADKAGSYIVYIALSKSETYYKYTGDASLTFTVKDAPKAQLPAVSVVNSAAVKEARSTTLVGDQLTVSVPGLAAGNDYTVKWYIKGGNTDGTDKEVTADANTNGASYTVKDADNGKTIYAKVVGKGGNYDGAKATTSEYKVTGKKLTGTVTITGTTSVGSTLTLNGVNASNIGVAYSIDWTIVDANGTKIADIADGANKTNVTVPATAAGYKIKATVTGMGDYAGSTLTATTANAIGA